MILKMALRNIGRNRGRTALSLLAIAVGVMVVVFAKGFIDGMIESVVDNAVRISKGHIRIVEADYPKKERLLSLTHVVDGFAGEGYESVLKKIESVDGVTVAAPRIRFGALISHGDEFERVMGVGVDLAREEKAAHLSRYIQDGRYPRPGKGEILVGLKLLDKLNLKVGDHLTLVANTAFGSFAGSTFTVSGAMLSGLSFLDEGSIYMALPDAQRFMDMSGAVTEIAVLVAREGDIPKIAPRIQSALDAGGTPGHYTATPYYETDPLLAQVVAAKRIYNFIYLAIVLLASFVVMNTMLMIVNERVREIGALGALGFTPRQISRLFVLEGAVMGFLGSLGGAAVGGLLTKILSVNGIDFTAAMKGLDPKLLYPNVIYPSFSLGLLVFAVVLGTVIPTLAVYMPARRAQKLNPSEALRTV